jgi:arginine decarboxylase-like protein
MTKHWNVDAARAQYAIQHWGEGYFDVDGRGRLSVRPRGADGPALALPEIVDAARARGSRLPLLVRFADILRHRLAPAGRIRPGDGRWDYAGGYTAVSGQSQSAEGRGRRAGVGRWRRLWSEAGPSRNLWPCSLWPIRAAS